MASSKMAASTIGRLQSILAQQLEMAALHRARESPVYDTLQHSFVLNQCNSAPYIPAAAPSSTVSPSSVTCTDQLEEANPLHFQSPTEQPTQMSSRWMTESWTKEEFALEDTDQYGINDVNHANLLNTDNVKQANVNDNVMTVRESFMNNTSFADADQFSINDGNHAGLLSAHDINQDNANDDAITVRESFVDNETFIPEHSKVATKDVDSPSLQSINYKHLKNNKMRSDAGPNASSLRSFTYATAYQAWWHSTVESQDTKSAHMSDRILEKDGVIDGNHAGFQSPTEQPTQMSSRWFCMLQMVRYNKSIKKSSLRSKCAFFFIAVAIISIILRRNYVADMNQTIYKEHRTIMYLRNNLSLF